MNLNVVGSNLCIEDFFNESRKSLYMLRPNGAETIEIVGSSTSRINLSTKVLVSFVDDNFPQFKLFPINEREEFASVLLNQTYWESSTQIFLHSSQQYPQNTCLSLYLQTMFPNKKVIVYRDYSQSLTELNGMSISSLYDIGIIDKRAFFVTYPLKIAANRDLRYEDVSDNSMGTTEIQRLKSCA